MQQRSGSLWLSDDGVSLYGAMLTVAALAGCDRHLQGVYDELGPQVCSHRPANDSVARGGIEDKARYKKASLERT